MRKSITNFTITWGDVTEWSKKELKTSKVGVQLVLKSMWDWDLEQDIFWLLSLTDNNRKMTRRLCCGLVDQLCIYTIPKWIKLKSVYQECGYKRLSSFSFLTIYLKIKYKRCGPIKTLITLVQLGGCLLHFKSLYFFSYLYH